MGIRGLARPVCPTMASSSKSSILVCLNHFPFPPPTVTVVVHFCFDSFAFGWA